jgi:hypothetical protein
MSTETQRREWRGALTSADMSKMIPVDFAVPAGVTNLHITFLYSPQVGPEQKLPHQVSVSILRSVWGMHEMQGHKVRR